MGALKPEALVVGRTGGFFVSAGPALADDTPTTRRRRRARPERLCSRPARTLNRSSAREHAYTL